MSASQPTLLKLLQSLKESQRKSATSKEDTEMIIPYLVKRSILQKCNEFPLSPAPKDTDLSTLGYAISILNQYMFYDPVLEKILHYLSQHKKTPTDVIKRLYIHTYTSPEIIPQPFYQVIKDNVEERGVQFATLFSCHCYVLFMIGNVIGFVIVQENTASQFYFETDAIKSIFTSKYPSITGLD